MIIQQNNSLIEKYYWISQKHIEIIVEIIATY